jgi:hypothetical protein
MSDDPLIAKADEVVALAQALRDERADVRADQERLLSNLRKLTAELASIRAGGQTQRAFLARARAGELTASTTRSDTGERGPRMASGRYERAFKSSPNGAGGAIP